MLDSETRYGTLCEVKPYSAVSFFGLLSTYDIAVDLMKRGLDGAFVECGVARGGCSALMAMVAAADGQNRKTWLFDSFEGMPDATEDDEQDWGLERGSFASPLENVERLLFEKFGLERDNVSIIKGWFSDTLNEYSQKVGPIALLRLDADWYDSTKCCLNNLYGNVVKGGYVIIDDYEAFPGCKKAVDEFFSENGITAKLMRIDWTGHYFIK
ncbi:MAG: class I SAM-dependent methyltransferase [Spirochaetales bacterium]|nr:class I SAM-dependent methyltransferase [Spirochaetales bacterium]